MNDAHWSLEVLVGLPVGLALLVTLLVAGVVFLLRANDDRGLEPTIYGCVFITLAVTLALVLAYGFYPYGAEYHRWEPKSGKVTEVASRMVGGSGSAQERFVVLFAGDAQPYSCDDTRCALVKVDDLLELSCIREWRYSGTDGYHCNYVGRNRP